MKKFLVLFGILLGLMMTAPQCWAQRIAEGDTLWSKNLGGDYPRKVQFTSDGSKLCAVTEYSRLFMFDAMTGDEIWKYENPNYLFSRFAFSANEDFIYIMSSISDDSKCVFSINSQNGKVIDSLFINPQHEGQLEHYYRIYLTPDPNKLILSDGGRKMGLFDISKKEIVREVGTWITKVFACHYSNYVISAELDWVNDRTEITLRDATTLDFVAHLGYHPGVVNVGNVIISKNGKYAASNVCGENLFIWDLENKTLFKRYTPTIPTDSTKGTGLQRALAFTNDNDYIINCGGDISWFPDRGLTTTITNIKNDKREYIYTEWSGSHVLDVRSDDQYFAIYFDYNLRVLRLKKDAVPVKEEEKRMQTLYPNPSTGLLTIDLEQSYEVNRIEIYNDKGIIVKAFNFNEFNINGNSITINATQLPSGSYFLNLHTARNIFNFKLLIVK